MSNKIEAALLDIDGTLVDSNDAHADAWHAAFMQHGIVVDRAVVRAAIGKGGDKLLPDVAGVADGSPLADAITQTRKAIFRREHLPTLRAFDGVRDLVSRLEDHGLLVAVATSASKDEVGALLEIAGLSHLVDKAASADDVDRSKPDPDVIGACVARLAVPTRAAILVGDTPYDVEAGARAGVKVIGVESGGWKAADLSSAIAVYRDAAHLAGDFEGSPFIVHPASWSGAAAQR